MKEILISTIILFVLFFINGTYYGNNPKAHRGIYYSLAISVFLFLMFNLLGANLIFSEITGVIAGLGFYSGFKKGKNDLKKIEFENEKEKI